MHRQTLPAAAIIKVQLQIQRWKGSLMSVSANRVWRQMSEEIRIAACKILWAESPNAQKRYLYAALANAKKLREVFVRKSSMERLVHWTATTMMLPEPIVEEIVKGYLLHEHRAVIIHFLELLQIPHTDGMIEESFDCGSLNSGDVQKAARKLLAEADRTGAELYLKYLVLQGDPWTGIEEVLPAEE